MRDGTIDSGEDIRLPKTLRLEFQGATAGSDRSLKKVGAASSMKGIIEGRCHRD